MSMASRFGRRLCGDGRASGTSPGIGALAGTSAGPLVRDDPPAVEDLAAPDPGRLLALQRPGQATLQDRAAGAEFLGPLELARFGGEPQVLIVFLAGQPERSGVALRGYLEPVRA